MPNLADLRRKAKNILFIDIETVSGTASFDLMTERMQEAWTKKSNNLKNEDNDNPFDLFYKRSAIYSEFGKVVCIGVGGLYWNKDDEMAFKVKTLANDDERTLLLEFKELVEKYADKLILCAHNGKEFDFPYLCRRMLVNGVELPESMQLSGKKPWEILHQDTLDLWRFGDHKNFAPLDLLAVLFNVPSSKSDISGEDVTRVYYKDNDLKRIRKYCVEDVVVLAQIWLRMQSFPLIAPNLIFRAE
jgi:3'-5' exonuclease